METGPSETEEKTPSNKETAEIKYLLFRLITSTLNKVKPILNLREGVDQENAINGIIKDIDFKGYNVYILICSIFIASIGLNVNSTAVVIGAMLISPLMGPILGIGLSVGTNDFTLLKRSLRSLGIAACVALLTSTIYFLLTPLKDEQSELLARTTPTLLDAFIALFGGFAGIIAGSRKEKTNVVPGVAIATALMPPLCTAGYGLAIGNFSYFFGAFYLFLLNSIFISISTFIVVKYLGFPVKSFVNPDTEKKVKRYIYTFVVVVLIPSGFIFWNVIKQSYFKNRVNQFLIENAKFEGTEIINQKINYNDSLSTIELFVMGNMVPVEVEKNLNVRLKSYGLENTMVKIFQAKDNTSEIASKLSQQVKSGILEDIYKKNSEIIEEKNQYIIELENKLFKYEKDTIPFKTLRKEVEIQYSEIEKFGFGFSYEVKKDFNQVDTIPTFLATWQEGYDEDERLKQQKRLSRWLETRLKLDTVRVIGFKLFLR